MFLYRDILKKSLKISWHYKYLWFFGLFASILGSTGKYNISFSRMNEEWGDKSIWNLAALIRTGIFKGEFISHLVLLFKQDPISVIVYSLFIIVIIILSVFLLWLVIVSQAGLINNAAKIIKNGNKIKTTLEEGVSAGAKKFWPVLWLNLLINCLIFFLAILIGLPLVFVTPEISANINLLYFVLFIIFIPIVLILSFLLKYAICFVIIKNEKVVDALISAWKIFTKNWLISIEMAFILFFVDVLFILALGMVILITAVPYLFVAFGLASLISTNIFWLMFVLGIVLTTLLVVLGGSILTCFKLVAWTDLFIHLIGKGGLPKIVRFAEKLKK